MSKYLYLLHGFYESSWIWDQVKTELENKLDYKIITPDLLGFGINKTNQVTYKAQAEDIISSFPKNSESISIIAHSSSGTTLALILENYNGDNIDKAIFLDSTVTDSNTSLLELRDVENQKRLEQESLDNNGFIKAKLPIVQNNLFTSIDPEEVEIIYFPKLEPTPFNLYKDKPELSKFYANSTFASERIFIECELSSKDDYRKKTAKKIQAELISIKADHQVMLTNPGLFIETITNLFS